MWLTDEQRATLAAYAKRERESVGLSDTEAARESQVSYQSIRKIERGAYCTVYASSLVRLAKVYQCDADEFCRLAGVIPDDLQEALLEPGAFARVRAALGRGSEVPNTPMR
jgi:transcriptional regulator with XRE-family HTH domain